MTTREQPSGSLFGGVDRAVFAASFADRLRGAGVDVALTAVERCVSALDVLHAVTLSDLYWLTRVSFVSRRGDVPAFDAVFAALFDVEMGSLVTDRRGQQASAATTSEDRLVALRREADTGDAASHAVPWATVPAVSFDHSPDDSDGDDDAVIRELRPSAEASEMDRPFDLLDSDELARVGALLEAASTQWPQRRSRRRRPSRSGGTVSLRRSLRRSMHTGGDVMTLIHTTPHTQPRRIVVLLDVSGSMESCTRAYLHLVRPLAIGHRAEVFAFATELSRVTAAVRMRSAADAVDHMSDVVGDRFSGTRIASSVRTLLHHRVWNTCVRGAVVVIFSDGWDTDDPAQMDRAMRRLSLLAHRVVWVNPRAAAPGFEPRAGGMAAAMPHCEHVLAGATGRSMHDVIAAITTRRRG